MNWFLVHNTHKIIFQIRRRLYYHCQSGWFKSWFWSGAEIYIWFFPGSCAEGKPLQYVDGMLFFNVLFFW